MIFIVLNLAGMVIATVPTGGFFQRNARSLAKVNNEILGQRKDLGCMRGCHYEARVGERCVRLKLFD